MEVVSHSPIPIDKKGAECVASILQQVSIHLKEGTEQLRGAESRSPSFCVKIHLCNSVS